MADVDDPARQLRDLVDAVQPADADVRAGAEAHLAALATAPGALADLGALAVRLAAAGGTWPPAVVGAATVVVAAGDHGVHARGVSPRPRATSATMAATVAAGRAGVSAIAAATDCEVVVVDVGLAGPVGVEGVADGRVVHGTRDATVEDAMTAAEVVAAVRTGAHVAERALAAGATVLAAGNVGVASTTTSAVLVAATTGLDAAAVTGRGSGVDDDVLARRVAVVDDVLARVRGGGGGGDPLRLLAAVGGAEHAALVGVLLAGAAARAPVVLDGVVGGAAALVAARLAPAVVAHLVAGHRSPGPGASVALDALGLVPVLDLGLRLGEGSGAALAVPVVRAASRLLVDVATHDEALGAG